MKERIKTFILIFLVLSSIGLTSITWTQERLWPEGYSLFVNFKKWPVIRLLFEDDYSMPLENLSRARKIVLADGKGSSAVFYNSDKNYDEIYGVIKNLMVSFLGGKTEVIKKGDLTKENVRVMLNEQLAYAYVNYSVAGTPKLFGQLMGVPEENMLSELSAVRDFFIIPTGTNAIELLAIDYNDESVKYYEINYDATEELVKTFTGSVANVDPAHNCTLALEMNLDIKNPEDIVKTPALVDSFLVFDTASTADVTSYKINSTNPLSGELGEINNNSYLDNVITCFGYNPKSIYRYVDSQGTIIYLENDSTLKIYKNGIIEYEALDPKHGVVVSESGNSMYESLNSAIKFAESVYKAAAPQSTFSAEVSSDLLSSGGEMNFNFDYLCNGNSVFVDVKEGDNSLNHAV
ncbi:MAG: hypothetical protein Q8882_04760, partial [Bacillota bacterium]|nr:hypothetical protein [Bacillota bacterium]